MSVDETAGLSSVTLPAAPQLATGSCALCSSRKNHSIFQTILSFCYEHFFKVFEYF